MSYDDDEQETLAAYVYRGGRVVFTLLIDRDTWGWYSAYPENQPDNYLAQAKCLDQIQREMDQYLNGYAAGYDKAVEDTHAEEGTRHHRTTAEVRETRWHQRHRGGEPPVPGERRD